MLVGPTPGVEYPLDRERLTIGRAEDASISVNHNSVSRLHCEVHALGDGRYEIVDKGSSNGVRVNAVELKRSIIEAGDVIELGDVRFKFVGAGQVFVPGPNESQQLTAISDREAELADPRRKGWGGYALPIVGAGVVGALIILGFVYFLRTRAQPDPLPNGQIGASTDNEQALVMEAKKGCTADDCDAAYASVAALPDKSPWRDSVDFKQIEALWAESMFKKARATEEVGQKRLLLGKVAAARTLDDAHRKQLAAELAALDEPAPAPTPAPTPTPTQQPVAIRDPAPPTSAVAPPTPSVKPNTPPHPTGSAGVAPTSGTTPTAKPSGVSVLDRARAAALDGRAGEVRALLGARVRSGAGTPEEVRLVKGACQSLGDMACIEDIKRHQ
jgi:pSer/pThr/pTyr-binding forkhead associated (FHA) protein